MRLLKKIGIAAGVLLVVVTGGALAVLHRLGQVGDGLCGNELLGQHPSPDGRLKLVVFERNCGATTGFITHVSVLKASEDLANVGGNVFVGDTNQGAAPRGPGGGPDVRVRWLSGEAAELRHHASVRVFRAERAVNGIQVTYVAADAR